MSSPNSGGEVGAQPNNGDEVGAQGSDSQHTTTTSRSWSSPFDPCPSIDRAARHAETRDPTYNPKDEEVQFNNSNQGLRGVVIHIHTYVLNIYIYDWLFFIDNFSIAEPNGGRCIEFCTRGN